jgi:hypothetical protein
MVGKDALGKKSAKIFFDDFLLGQLLLATVRCKFLKFHKGAGKNNGRKWGLCASAKSHLPLER